MKQKEFKLFWSDSDDSICKTFATKKDAVNFGKKNKDYSKYFRILNCKNKVVYTNY